MNTERNTMARNAKEVAGSGNDSKMDAPLLPAGAYPARVVSVIYLGVQTQRPYMGEAKSPVDEVRITYELSDEFMADEDGNPLTEKPRWFSEDIPFYSLNADRAKSTKRYKALDPSDTADGDFFKLIGMACQVVLVQNEGKGKNAGRTFTNIADVTPAPRLKGYVQAELVNPSVTFDPMDDNVNLDVFRNMFEGLRKKIIEAIDHVGSPLQLALGGGATSKRVEETPEEVKEEVAGEEEMY